jgi:hypothetical protein
MWSQIVAISALASLVAAAPTAHFEAPQHDAAPQRDNAPVHHPVPAADAAFTALPQLARFENEDGATLIPNSPIGIYADLFWQGFSLLEQGLNAIGIEPQSPNNYAAYGFGQFILPSFRDI